MIPKSSHGPGNRRDFRGQARLLVTILEVGWLDFGSRNSLASWLMAYGLGVSESK